MPERTVRRVVSAAIAATGLVLAACTGGPGSTSTPSPSPSTTAAAGPAPSASPDPTRPASARGTTLAAEDLRFLITCSHLDGSPDISRYSLAEVWASTGYVRIKDCTVAYRGPDPYVPTDEEAAAVAKALPGSATGSEALDAVVEAMRLCTRIPDETGLGGFASAPENMLGAAAALCPDGPQGKIIEAWAHGERFADGGHTGGGDIAPGDYGAVRPDAQCRWSVSSGGAVVASGGAADAGRVTVADGAHFTSDNCGIWEKMY